MIHHLKLVQPYFDAVNLGFKTFELRFNDRNYQVGDFVQFSEWDLNRQVFTGRQTEFYKIMYVLEQVEGLQKGFCIFGMDPAFSE